jgi:hypothetical protein
MSVGSMLNSMPRLAALFFATLCRYLDGFLWTQVAVYLLWRSGFSCRFFLLYSRR